MKRTRITGVRPALDGTQMGWLGALLLVVQSAQAYHMPAWIAVFGLGLVAFRLLLQRRTLAERELTLSRIPSYVLALFAVATALGLRHSFGLFLGRDPCVAFLFVLVGIKYVEARSLRDGTLLVCLASFLMVTPFFYNQSLLAALAAVPGLLLLAATLQALAPPAEIKPRNRLRDPLRRAARLLVEGIPLAMLLFVLFPRLPGPLWGLPADFITRSGLSDHMKPNSISQLSLSDAVAFRVDFVGAIPAAHQRYWRGPVFTRFDGEEWTAPPGRQPGRFAPGLGAQTVLYTVTLEPTYRTSLFALDLPAALPKSTDPSLEGTASELGALTRDQQLISRSAVTQPLRYTQVSLVRDAYPATRGMAGETERYDALQLPGGNPRSRAFAQSLRRDYGDDSAIVAAVLGWLREQPFFYTLSPPVVQGDVIDRFLFETRRGFCEHYAGAFVVLMRAAGIPARVVTGYQGGEINPNGDYLIVRQSDAHAWAEVLIGGQWRRVDPTAAVAPSRIERGLGAALPSDERVPLFARIDEGWLKRVQLAWDGINHDWRRHVIGFNYAQQQTLWSYWHLERWAPWEIVLGVILVTSAWGGGLLLWFRLRQRQRDDRVVTLWNALCKRLRRAGLPREPHEGPLAYASRAAGRWPAFAAAFMVIGQTYAQLRYGRLASAPDSHAGRSSAVARLRHAMAVLPTARALRRSAIVP